MSIFLLPVDGKMFSLWRCHLCVFERIVRLTLIFVIFFVCVFSLFVVTVFFCFCRSLGSAPDCCPLLRHCPIIEPKAVWLPLQATLSMATFHSHLFSLWLWHIHIKNIHKRTQSTIFCCLKERRRYQNPLEDVYDNWIGIILHLFLDEDTVGCVKCICQITPYVSVVGPVWFWRCGTSDVSGVDTALTSHIATLHESIFFKCCIT